MYLKYCCGDFVSFFFTVTTFILILLTAILGAVNSNCFLLYSEGFGLTVCLSTTFFLLALEAVWALTFREDPFPCVFPSDI